MSNPFVFGVVPHRSMVGVLMPMLALRKMWGRNGDLMAGRWILRTLGRNPWMPVVRTLWPTVAKTLWPTVVLIP